MAKLVVRRGFKIPRQRWRVGSSPTIPTNSFFNVYSTKRILKNIKKCVDVKLEDRYHSVTPKSGV